MTKPLDTNLLLHASHIAICIYGSLVTCRFWIVKLSELDHEFHYTLLYGHTDIVLLFETHLITQKEGQFVDYTYFRD